MGCLSGGDFVLADGEQFVVAQGFELGLENIDHGHRMAESVEDFGLRVTGPLIMQKSHKSGRADRESRVACDL